MKSLSQALDIRHYECDYSLSEDDYIPLEQPEMMRGDNNPMRDKITAKMVSNTIRESFASGKRKPRKLSEEERRMHSERMKANNPLRLNPEKTNTAKPISVVYENGTVESYAYAKELSNVKGIPYDTVKWMLKNNKGSKKHNIKHIIQKEKICQG